MPQEKALAALASHYTLEPVKPAAPDRSRHSILILTGKTPVGSVAFQSSRLLSVFKYWDPPDQEKGVELARKFCAAVGFLVKDGYRTCVLDVGSSEEPRLEQRVAFRARCASSTSLTDRICDPRRSVLAVGGEALRR